MLPTGTLTIATLLLLRTICRTFLLVLRLFVRRRAISLVGLLAVSIGLVISIRLPIAIILLGLAVIIPSRIVEIIVTRLYNGVIPILFQLIDLRSFFFMG